MKLLSPIYNLLSIFAILIFIPSLFFGKQYFDVHLHDTYYVLPIGQFLKLNAFILLALWMIYKLSENVLYSSRLTRFHVFVSVIAAVVMSTSVYWGQFTIWTTGKRYYPQASELAGRSSMYIHLAIGITLIAFAIAQLVLILNIVMGLLAKNRNGRA